jgi:hypothetical protein
MRASRCDIEALKPCTIYSTVPNLIVSWLIPLRALNPEDPLA